MGADNTGITEEAKLAERPELRSILLSMASRLREVADSCNSLLQNLAKAPCRFSPQFFQCRQRPLDLLQPTKLIDEPLGL